MMRWATAAAALVLAGAGSVQAADSCGGGCPVPPTYARSMSMAEQLLPAQSFAPLGSTKLRRGMRKTILHVDAIFTSGMSAPQNLYMLVTVNGIRLEPTEPNLPFNTRCAFPNSSACTLSVAAWIDLDQNPSLIGVPLDIAVIGGDTPHSPGSTYTLTLHARLTKK